MSDPLTRLHARRLLSVALVTALLLVLCSGSDLRARELVAQAASMITGNPVVGGPLALNASETGGAIAAARAEAHQRTEALGRTR